MYKRYELNYLTWIVIVVLFLNSLMSVHVTSTYSLQYDTVCTQAEIGPQGNVTIHDIKNCDVMEGSLSIARINASEWNSSMASSIREITGYLLIYQVYGLKSLQTIFPNLQVIRGNQLFGDKYSLIIYENVDLFDIGLVSLVNILKGSIRIENNPVLCFVDTINWIKILSNMTSQHYVLKRNKNSTECPTCPEVTQNSQAFKPCWNWKHLQKICPEECGNRACNSHGECCNELCLSDCINSRNTSCNICRTLKHTNGQCVQKCGVNLYELNNRRCVPETKCAFYNLIVHDGVCWENCPKDFYAKNSQCEPCNHQCYHECNGTVIRTIKDLQKMRGCTKIKGSLTIELKEKETRVNELEDNLSDVTEISDYLRIMKSPQIVSLYFLRNLQKIQGKKLLDNKYSLYVFENHHLEQLWMPNQTVNILAGKVFFHFNPKLCYEIITKLLPSIREVKEFSILDVSNQTNGARVVCEPNIDNLNVTIEDKNATAVRIKIDPILFDDKRVLLGYFFYYMEATKEIVTKFDNRHGCGHDNWKLDLDTSKNVRHIIKNLKPYTRYAYFVKTFTIASAHIKQDASSEIQYFETLPDTPGPVRKFYCYSKTETEMVLHWWPPSKPQGEIERYIIDYEQTTIRNPINKTNETNETKSLLTDELKKALNETETYNDCNCGIEKYESRGPTPEEDNFYEREALIFEDALADFIYIPVAEKTLNGTNTAQIIINGANILNISNVTNATSVENTSSITNGTSSSNATNSTNQTNGTTDTTNNTNDKNTLNDTNPTHTALNSNYTQNCTNIENTTITFTTTKKKSLDDIKKTYNIDDEGKMNIFQILDEKSKKEMDTGTAGFPILQSKTCEINGIPVEKHDYKKCWDHYYNGIMIDGSLHKFILKNLYPGTLYKISIRACNKNVSKCSVKAFIDGRTLDSDPSYYPRN